MEAEMSTSSSTSTSRRSRGFSLSTIATSRRLSVASSAAATPSHFHSPTTTSSPSRIKRVFKRISPFKLFRRSSANGGRAADSWIGFDTDYMYDDDIDVSYEGLLSLAARIGDAKPKHLPSEFKAGLPRARYRDLTSSEQVEKDCAICLEKYHDNDEMMGISECGHYFHTNCFETWLDLASNCPVCRKELTPDNYQFDLEQETQYSPRMMSGFEFGSPVSTSTGAGLPSPVSII